MLNTTVNYNKVYYFILLLIAVLLPFTEYSSKKYTSMAIILLVVCWLLFSDKKEVLTKLRANAIIFLFIGVYLINLNGLLRETGADITGKILVKKLPLFLLPLIIGTSPDISFNRIKLILIAFIASLLISTLFTYSNGISYLLKLQDDITDVANVIIIHRPYYGLLIGFAVLCLFLFFRKKQSIWLLSCLCILIIYLSLFLAIIYVKMGLLSITISLIALVFCFLAFNKKYLILFLCTLLMAGGIATIFKLKPSLQNYTTKILQGKEFSFTEYNVVLVGSINTRYINWGCAYKILKEDNNWIYGVGPGNAQNLLQSCYKLKNEWVYQSKMNSHNQFLEELLHNGIFGLLIFLSSILFSLFISIKRRNYFYLSFLLVFSLCCLTESVLGRQIGIVFYAFFNSLLLFNQNYLNKTNIDLPRV